MVPREKKRPDDRDANPWVLETGAIPEGPFSQGSGQAFRSGEFVFWGSVPGERRPLLRNCMPPAIFEKGARCRVGGRAPAVPVVRAGTGMLRHRCERRAGIRPRDLCGE